MSDFAQTGLICTLQRLNEAHLETIESRLLEVAKNQIALILPCHARDLDRPSLEHIVSELKNAKWLGEVVVSMNGLDDALCQNAQCMFETLPQKVNVLWNDRNGETLGKGANVEAAFRFLLKESNATVFATQDCDVVSFRKADLARLCYPVVAMEYRFAKAYYSRVTDRLYGRVSRLFLAPLLHAFVKVSGHQPLLDFLASFRYPLSGEVAMHREVAAALPPFHGWNLEIGQLCEVFRHADPREICQVDGGGGYDHRHQPATTALADMAGEIAAELFRQMKIEGLPDDANFKSAIASAYCTESALALKRFASLAQINALPFDETGEREIVESFAQRVAG